MKPTVYMEEMDAFTYREKLAKDAVVFIPVGALEQHGSHMAMCVDAALTKAMAGATAEALVADTDGAMEAVVAAPINYGYRSQQRSGGGFHLSGTTSLSGTTLIALAKDVVFGLILHGARKIVLMNGHYENYQFIFEGAELALEKARENGIRDVKIQLLSYWDFVDDETIEALYPDGFTGWDLEHAGVMETSLMLLFHPDLIRGTSLGRSMDEYTFFSYEANEALHLSEQERLVVLECLQNITGELNHAIDKHSRRLIVSNIELLLNYSIRFYERQFITRSEVNKDALSRFERLLNDYFKGDTPQRDGVPSVRWCAEQLHLSANYFGDLIKKETGKSAQEYIQLKVIDIAKERIFDATKSISEIAYELGFRYPQHFTRLFKKCVGMSPNEYRTTN